MDPVQNKPINSPRTSSDLLNLKLRLDYFLPSLFSSLPSASQRRIRVHTHTHTHTHTHKHHQPQLLLCHQHTLPHTHKLYESTWTHNSSHKNTHTDTHSFDPATSCRHCVWRRISAQRAVSWTS